MPEHIVTIVKLKTEGKLQKGDLLHSTIHGRMVFEYAPNNSSFVAKLENSEQRIKLTGWNLSPGTFIKG